MENTEIEPIEPIEPIERTDDNDGRFIISGGEICELGIPQSESFEEIPF